MGLRRWLTIMTCLTAAGVMISRPDDVVPAAARFIAPLQAQQQARSVEPGACLPDFIPGEHHLTFKRDDPVSLAAHAPDPEAATAAAPMAMPPSEPVIPVVAETVETSEKPSATAAADTAAVAPQPATALAEQPAPAAAPAAASIDPLAPEDGSKPVQVVTIEPDPTLPLAQTHRRRAAYPGQEILRSCQGAGAVGGARHRYVCARMFGRWRGAAG